MPTDTQWYIYAGIAGGAVLVLLAILAFCLWHRARGRTGRPENERLLNGNATSNRDSRAQQSSARAAPADQLLDADAWNRINMWVIDVCRHYNARDMAPLEDVDYTEHAVTTPSASYTNRGAHLVPITSDETLPATPRTAVGLSPRVSVGAGDGIAPASSTPLEDTRP
jgi:hypothetical protein